LELEWLAWRPQAASLEKIIGLSSVKLVTELAAAYIQSKRIFHAPLILERGASGYQAKSATTSDELVSVSSTASMEILLQIIVSSMIS
jgi:hypothetical protein